MFRDMASTISYGEAIDEILAGDQTIMLATVTPASGVVLLPVTNFVLRERETATLNVVNSSLGVRRKLDRIRANPRVALAYHSREHGLSHRPEYVLVQGTATITEPDPRYLDSLLGRADRQLAELAIAPTSTERIYADSLRHQVPGGWFWDWWLRDWHHRVGIDVAVERVITWPDLGCRGGAEVYGTPSPGSEPAPQREPANGTAPRIQHHRAARRTGRLPHTLLGWVGADGLPVAIPAEVTGADPRGILLAVAEGLVPPGGRRAGLTAHWFGRNDVGLRQRVYTGWLEQDPGAGRVVYAPHTEASFTIPRSRLAFWIAAGGGTRLQVTQPIRAPVAVVAALRRRLSRHRHAPQAPGRSN
jgi:pyridoxamine 5'-phosphate oxidase-like protein